MQIPDLLVGTLSTGIPSIGLERVWNENLSGLSNHSSPVFLCVVL